MQQWSYQNTVLSKYSFIKIQFYQKTVSSEDSLFFINHASICKKWKIADAHWLENTVFVMKSI